MSFNFAKYCSFLILINLFLQSNDLKSQTIINGNIVDESGIELPFVRIIQKDSVNGVLCFKFSDQKGNYKIELEGEKDSISYLEFSHIGYATFAIKVKKDSINVQELNVTLKSEESVLEEVVVKSRMPVLIKQDTVVFDADFYSNGNEEVIEDLLRKIPGLNIDDNGTIRVGSKEIEKVMVEGDDFFEKGYKILTKNMPVYPISEIEVISNYSSNHLLKNIENSDKIALNLKLTNDTKSTWFANVVAGYSIENRHTVTANVFNFGKKNKYYFLSNLNNVGVESVGEIEHLINPEYSGDLNVLGDVIGAQSLFNSNSPPSEFKLDRVNINNDKLLSSNAIFNPNSKLKIKAIGFVNRDGRSFFQNSLERFQVSNSNFTNVESNSWKDLANNLFAKIELNYDLNPKQQLNISSSVGISNRNKGNSLIFNDEETTENLFSENYRIDQKVSFTSKINERKIIIFNGRFVNSFSPQDYKLDNFLFSDLFLNVQNPSSIQQMNNIEKELIGGEIIFLNRLKNKDLFEFHLGNKYTGNRLNSTFLILDSLDIEIDRPLTFQNDLNYFGNDLYLKSKYEKKFKTFSIISKVEFHFLENRVLGRDDNNDQSVFYINPSIAFSWKLSKKQNFIGSYSFSTKNADVIDIYENYALTGFRMFSSGTGEFNQLNSSNVIFNHQYGSWGDNFFINSSLFYNKDHDFFSSNLIVDQNFVLSEKILFQNRSMLGINSAIDNYIAKISSNLKLKLNYSDIQYFNIVNSLSRRVNAKNYSYGFDLRSSFSGKFNYHFGSNWMSSVVSANTTFNFTNNISFIDLLYKYNQKSNLGIQIERYYFGSIENNSKGYYFFDLDWRYTVIPNKLNLTLSGKNLLNNKNFSSVSVTDISFAINQYQLLPRYLMLKAQYRF